MATWLIEKAVEAAIDDARERVGAEENANPDFVKKR